MSDTGREEKYNKLNYYNIQCVDVMWIQLYRNSVIHYTTSYDDLGNTGLQRSRKKLRDLISNFRRVLYVVCFLLDNFPASEFYMPTFRNTLSVPSS
jgi:hypothetical protein